jgi:hypothetical protein
VLKKDDAVSNGDAWRTTINACLPVLNLIDTWSSIPHDIQQVKEHIGILYAFDQVVHVSFLISFSSISTHVTSLISFDDAGGSKVAMVVSYMGVRKTMTLIKASKPGVAYGLQP